MSDRAWRRATRDDIPALSSFLAGREERCAGFTGRLLRDEGPAARLHLPTPIRGGVWIADDASRIAGAVLCHPSGVAFPALPDSPEDDGLLGGEMIRLSSSRIWRAASVTGIAADVDRFEAAARLEPIVKVGYILMSLPALSVASSLAKVRYSRSVPSRGDFTVRRASAADMDALVPLQEAYEREEVLTPIHEFNAVASRAALARSLELQRVYVALEKGRVVAKAGTNARGFGVDQIGGVFTLPEKRGRGAAFALMAALLTEIGAEGRGVALFVKPGNAPAIALYRRLGFASIGDFRADYMLD